MTPTTGFHAPNGTWTLPSHTRRIHVGHGADALTVYTNLVFEDGKPHMLMLTCSKQGSLDRGLLHLLGVTATLALQAGVPLATVAAAWRNTAFDPAGVTGDADMPMVSSIGDAIARWLERQVPAAPKAGA